MYALAGVVALGAGFLLYKAFSSGEGDDAEAAVEEPEINDEDLVKAGIKDVERNGKLLENRYFLRLLQFVGERTRDSTKAQREKITAERRQHYTAQDWPQYEAAVQAGLDLEDKAS